MLTIYGASDDLIEVEGDISEEFTALDDDGSLLAFSDGTVLRVRYTRDGIWRIEPLARGTARLEIVSAVSGDDDNYSDRATLDAPGGIAWAVKGDAWATRR